MGLVYRRVQNHVYLDNRRLPARQFDKKVLNISDVELTKTIKSPIYFGSSLWNALPHDDQDSKTY